ncbi:ribonuclease H-like domain-containing protein [Tanacetum coccineum]|uniref:Ribonuclease H-like domain-containing protein n=1 Tax=Tanacetum coccineum TaxID=301880 RepID=A0ABQ5CYJ1_9ASTR
MYPQSGYKARLVANGSTHVAETGIQAPTTPVSGIRSIHIMFAFSSISLWLKQAPGLGSEICAYAARVGFHHSRCDSSLFIYRQGADTAYLLLYVDDIVLTASSSDLLQQIITSLHAEFSMTDLLT